MDLTLGLAPLDNTRPIMMLDDVARDGYHPATLLRAEVVRDIWTTYALEPGVWADGGKQLSKMGFIYNPTVQTVLVPRQYVAWFESAFADEPVQ